VSGAISPGEVKKILSDLGFQNVTITPKEQSEEIIREWRVADGAENVVFSAYIRASKPDASAKSRHPVEKRGPGMS